MRLRRFSAAWMNAVRKWKRLLAAFAGMGIVKRYLRRAQNDVVLLCCSEVEAATSRFFCAYALPFCV